MTALTPGALAAGSASPSPSAASGPSAPKGTPTVVGVVPDPKISGQNWTGDRVSVNLVPNGSTLDTAKCKVFVNGKEQVLASPPSLIYLAPANPTLQFLLGVLVFHEQMPAARWWGFALVWLALVILATDGVRTGRANALARRAG